MESEDILFNEALVFIITAQQVSISSVQRKLNIGYNKATLLVRRMEEEKYITAPVYNGKRTVLLNRSFKFNVRAHLKYKAFIFIKFITAIIVKK